MSVVVGEIGWCTNVEYFGLFLVDGLEDTRVEHRGLKSWVDSNQQNDVSVFDHFDLRVEQIVGSEVVGHVEVGIVSELVVEAVESVEEVLQGLDVLYTFELSDSASDIVAIYLIDLGSNDSQGILPIILSKIGSFSDERYSQSLLSQTIESLSRFVRKPLLVERFVDSGTDPHDFVLFVVNFNVAAHGVHQVDRSFRQHFVWS